MKPSTVFQFSIEAYTKDLKKELSFLFLQSSVSIGLRNWTRGEYLPDNCLIPSDTVQLGKKIRAICIEFQAVMFGASRFPLCDKFNQVMHNEKDRMLCYSEISALLNPTSALPRIAIAANLVEHGRYDDAQHQASLALELSSTRSETSRSLRNLSALAQMRGEKGLSLSLIGHSRKVCPHDPVARRSQVTLESFYDQEALNESRKICVGVA